MNIENIGVRIKLLRTARGWSQATLAKKLKTSQSAVSKVERNIIPPTSDEIVNLFKIFEEPLVTDTTRCPICNNNSQ